MPMMKIADSLRPFALFVHAIHENCGTSQAVCMPLMNLPRVSGSEHFFGHTTHEKCGASQAACMAMMTIADSLRL